MRLFTQYPGAVEEMVLRHRFVEVTRYVGGVDRFRTEWVQKPKLVWDVRLIYHGYQKQGGHGENARKPGYSRRQLTSRDTRFRSSGVFCPTVHEASVQPTFARHTVAAHCSLEDVVLVKQDK